MSEKGAEAMPYSLPATPSRVNGQVRKRSQLETGLGPAVAANDGQ